MGAVEMSRAEAVALVRRIMQADYTSDDEVDGWLDRLKEPWHARPVGSAS